MQIREPRARGKAGQEGEADERGGCGRSGKEVAGERWRQGTRQVLRLRMRQQRDPIPCDMSGTRPGLHSVFCKIHFPEGHKRSPPTPQNYDILPAAESDKHRSAGRQKFIEFD